MRTALRNEELNMVNGGTAFVAGTYLTYQEVAIHKNCGGVIDHGNPYRKAKCTRCGEKHYWLSQFKYFSRTYEYPSAKDDVFTICDYSDPNRGMITVKAIED